MKRRSTGNGIKVNRQIDALFDRQGRRMPTGRREYFICRPQKYNDMARGDTAFYRASYFIAALRRCGDGLICYHYFLAAAVSIGRRGDDQHIRRNKLNRPSGRRLLANIAPRYKSPIETPFRNHRGGRKTAMTTITSGKSTSFMVSPRETVRFSMHRNMTW